MLIRNTNEVLDNNREAYCVQCTQNCFYYDSEEGCEIGNGRCIYRHSKEYVIIEEDDMITLRKLFPSNVRNQDNFVSTMLSLLNHYVKASNDNEKVDVLCNMFEYNMSCLFNDQKLNKIFTLYNFKRDDTETNIISQMIGKVSYYMDTWSPYKHTIIASFSAILIAKLGYDPYLCMLEVAKSRASEDDELYQIDYSNCKHNIQ